MTARLTSRIVIDALFRRVRAAGGFATVIAKGDDNAGGILALCLERGAVTSLLERASDFAGGWRWIGVGPQDVESGASRDSYIQRRQDSDPDLWVIELDIPGAERFAAESV